MIEIIAPSRRDGFHLSDAIGAEMLKPQVRINVY